MKKEFSALFLCFALIGCSTNNETSKNISQSPIKINSIEMGAMDGDISPKEISILINFSDIAINTSNWQFGFYMARTFNKLGNSTNPNQDMQICNTQMQCTTLDYQLAGSVTESDLSTGYTTILKPTTTFPLQSGNTYTIRLKHNNQWGISNTSAFLQNIFVTDLINQQVYNISPESNIFHVIGYNKETIKTQIESHNNTNWTNSIVNSRSNSDIIVPSPVNQTSLLGQTYTITSGIMIHNELNSNNSVADMIKNYLATDLKINSTIDNQSQQSNGIIIKVINDPRIIANNPEGYTLEITSNAIIISASNNAGVYYALQSLRQLWNKEGVTLSGLNITDYPRFKYRGILLDSSRHFFSESEIFSLINIMGTHKLNTLHWHLADDEAFRASIRDYPTLQSIGDIRGLGLNMGPMMFIQANLDITNYNQTEYPYANTIYSGTYSQNEMQDIISYANANQITIIPEVDLPGHARALIKALPEDFVDPNDKSEFISVQGYNDDVIPVCTYNTDISIGSKFTPTINNIINDIAQIFEGQTTLYAVENELSVGGDEVASDAWTNDVSCQGEWTNLSALDKSHLFFKKLAENNTNISFSGWQQAIQTDGDELGKNIIPPNRTSHIWVWNTAANGEAQATNLANKGYNTVLDYADNTYFDLAYTPDINEAGFTWATSFSDTYAALMSSLNAKNTIANIEPQNQANIVGLEGTLWSENLANYNHMIYMALPKMAGLSEASWSPSTITTSDSQINWQSLAQRLGCGSSGFLAYLNKLYSVHYRGYPNGINLEAPKSCE